jgi:hypothetical protein
MVVTLAMDYYSLVNDDASEFCVFTKKYRNRLTNAKRLSIKDAWSDLAYIFPLRHRKKKVA